MADISDKGDWNKNFPSGSSQVRDGDDLLRARQRSLQSTLDEEHFFVDSGSSTSAGIHQIGSARVYSGPRSELSASGADDDGRLFWDRDSETLHILENSSTSTVADSAAAGAASVVTSGTLNDIVSGNTRFVDFNPGGKRMLDVKLSVKTTTASMFSQIEDPRVEVLSGSSNTLALYESNVNTATPNVSHENFSVAQTLGADAGLNVATTVRVIVKGRTSGSTGTTTVSWSAIEYG